MAGLSNTKWMVTSILARMRRPVKRQMRRRLAAVAVVYEREGVKDARSGFRKASEALYL